MRVCPLLLAILAALPLVIALSAPGRAAAHAALRTASPGPGEVLSGSPAAIRLTFSEPLREESTFVVFNRAFETIAGIEPEVVAGREEQLASAVPQLEAGTYTVQWNVVGLDGHPTSGSYSFEVTAATGSLVSQWLLVFVVVIIATIASLLFIRRQQTRHQR